MNFNCSISFLSVDIFVTVSFSFSHKLIFWSSSLRILSISCLHSFNRFLEALSFSFLSASYSTSSWINLLLRSSIIKGAGFISMRSFDPASSIRSTALSGRNLSDIYFSDSVAADIKAESRILSPWCASYLSLIPRRIVIVSSIEGSFTSICCNRLSSAASGSIYF